MPRGQKWQDTEIRVLISYQEYASLHGWETRDLTSKLQSGDWALYPSKGESWSVPQKTGSIKYGARTYLLDSKGNGLEIHLSWPGLWVGNKNS